MWNAFGFFFDAGMPRAELVTKTREDFKEAERKWPQHFDQKVIVGENVPREVYETCLRTTYHEGELRKGSFVSLGLAVPGTLLRVRSLQGGSGWEKYGGGVRTHLIGGSLDGSDPCWCEDLLSDDVVVEYAKLNLDLPSSRS